jgi:hypothetical protein
MIFGIDSRADKHGKKNAFLRVKSAHFNAFETRISKKNTVFYQKTRFERVKMCAFECIKTTFKEGFKKTRFYAFKSAYLTRF